MEEFKEKTEELKGDLGQGINKQSPNEFFQKAVDSVQENEEKQPEQSDALHNEQALCAGHIAAAEHDFNALKQKYDLQADFQDFYAYACEHFEEKRNLDLSRYVDGLRSIERLRELCEMWQGIAADLRRKADWVQAFYVYTPEYINSFEATEPEQPAALQIKPLGPATGDELPSINFKDLGGGTKGNIRNLARASKSLLKEEDLPDDFKAILSNLLNTIVDFADADELLKKILERDDADTGQR